MPTPPKPTSASDAPPDRRPGASPPLSDPMAGLTGSHPAATVPAMSAAMPVDPRKAGEFGAPGDHQHQAGVP